ncbi:MAG: hypothetical protein R3E53_17165 [Myxococcota bacterium]
MFRIVFASGSIGVAFTIPYASQLGLPLVGGAAIRRGARPARRRSARCCSAGSRIDSACVACCSA